VNAPAPRGSNARAREAHLSSAFLLHSYPFRETSLIVEMFTQSHGRLGLLAKGARRPKSQLRGQLMAFQPMVTTWSGKSELKTLHSVEWEAGHLQLTGVQLMCGFYLNELLLKLLQREDPHEGLYRVYAQTVEQLREGAPAAKCLRRFERELLRELGYALQLESDVAGDSIRAAARYDFQIERGPSIMSSDTEAQGMVVQGATLLALATDGFAAGGETVEQEARTLMRHALSHYLNGQELRTRQLLRELQEL